VYPFRYNNISLKLFVEFARILCQR